MNFFTYGGFEGQSKPTTCMWKLNLGDRTITLTKLLIKHAKFTQKETEIGAYINHVLNNFTLSKNMN